MPKTRSRDRHPPAIPGLAILPRSHLDTVSARQALQLEVGDYVRYVGFVPFATSRRLVVLEALAGR